MQNKENYDINRARKMTAVKIFSWMRKSNSIINAPQNWSINSK